MVDVLVAAAAAAVAVAAVAAVAAATAQVSDPGNSETKKESTPDVP